jgi:hypothetical protein
MRNVGVDTFLNFFNKNDTLYQTDMRLSEAISHKIHFYFLYRKKSNNLGIIRPARNKFVLPPSLKKKKQKKMLLGYLE